MDEHPRRRIPGLFIARCVLAGVELGWTGFGTFVVSYKFPCDFTPHVLIIIWIVASWLLFFFFILGILVIFDPLGSTPCEFIY